MAKRTAKPRRPAVIGMLGGEDDGGFDYSFSP